MFGDSFCSFGGVIKQEFYRTASFKVIGWRGIEIFWRCQVRKIDFLWDKEHFLGSLWRWLLLDFNSSKLITCSHIMFLVLFLSFPCNLYYVDFRATLSKLLFILWIHFLLRQKRKSTVMSQKQMQNNIILSNQLCRTRTWI